MEKAVKNYFLGRNSKGLLLLLPLARPWRDASSTRASKSAACMLHRPISVSTATAASFPLTTCDPCRAMPNDRASCVNPPRRPRGIPASGSVRRTSEQWRWSRADGPTGPHAGAKSFALFRIDTHTHSPTDRPRRRVAVSPPGSECTRRGRANPQSVASCALPSPRQSPSSPACP